MSREAPINSSGREPAHPFKDHQTHKEGGNCPGATELKGLSL